MTGLDIKSIWDNQADAWAREVRAGLDIYFERFLAPAFLQYLGDLDGLHVLDAGCGEGRTSRLMAGSARRVTGVDISSGQIANAIACEDAKPGIIDYVVASVSHLEAFADNSFDTVASWLALQDVEDYDGAMHEFYRVLKPGGRLVYCVMHPCFASPKARLARINDENMIAMNGYFSGAPRILRWSFTNQERAGQTPQFAIPRFTRTLSEYLNPLLAAGFTLSELLEPRPELSVCAQVRRLGFWREEAALYLFVEARKAG